MATRFYLSSTRLAPITPAFDGGWTRTTEGDRRMMHLPKQSSPQTNKTFWGNAAAAANTLALNRQYISDEMAAGVGFVTTDTVRMVLRCGESAANDNINRAPTCLKVISADGGTVRATLLALAHRGPTTTEWDITGTATETRRPMDGDVLTANYTTVEGDRLLLEIGGQVSGVGGTSVTGTQVFGDDDATDYAENETQTDVQNPWFELSRDITFLPAIGDMSRAYPDLRSRVPVTISPA